MNEPTWNSLEIAKLVVAAITPLAVVAVGYVVSRSIRRVEQRQWFNQKLVERRIALLDEVLPGLNDLYCYFMWVGGWKELSPADIVARKRTLDRTFHANRPFIPGPTMAAYLALCNELFRTTVNPAKDALLRTGITSPDGDRKEACPGNWQGEWNALFADVRDTTTKPEVQARYDALLDRLRVDVGADADVDRSKVAP